MSKETERTLEVIRVYRANFDRPYRRAELRIKYPHIKELFDAVDNSERAILPITKEANHA